MNKPITFNAKEVKEQLIEWIRDFFDQNGKDCRAIIGISGGKDSSVVAALCKEALGQNRVIGVLMPNKDQKDIQDSFDLVNFLQIPFFKIDISKSVNGILDALQKNDCYLFSNNEKILPSLFRISQQTEINLPARIRMATLYAVAQSVNGRVANTSNYSEIYIGYSTRWGDSVGDFAPLANLTSDEVIAIGLECGLPERLVEKVPSDGLSGKTDEDNFGFTYETLNKYIKIGVCEDLAAKEKIDKMHNKNKFKTMPVPSFEIEKKENNSYHFDVSWLD